jgi:hypothetical protein
VLCCATSATVAVMQAQRQCAEHKERLIGAGIALEETRVCCEKLLELVDPEFTASTAAGAFAVVADGALPLSLVALRAFVLLTHSHTHVTGRAADVLCRRGAALRRRVQFTSLALSRADSRPFTRVRVTGDVALVAADGTASTQDVHAALAVDALEIVMCKVRRAAATRPRSSPSCPRSHRRGARGAVVWSAARGQADAAAGAPAERDGERDAPAVGVAAAAAAAGAVPLQRRRRSHRYPTVHARPCALSPLCASCSHNRWCSRRGVCCSISRQR